ncbi:hypothetical protein CALCODRAFT_556382 [Calocera cornea HHB12733]|uniref:Pentacotripeptide-repeat region of PRORP domain-containing protein n=1 Tax=Calocera cornea HHB12733 TaxID=1353952 RepID=A0A165ETV7_9BASI|nr:hypothetical protein CALCODRAFT_556382 [Calocera cornea HHB12733]
MSYATEMPPARQYYHSTYLPYQSQHAAGLSSTQRPYSGPSSAPDPATFDFPSGTTKYDCPWCDKTYAGPNGRSVWRRHAQEKHNLPCNSRRSRWDDHPDRPRNAEDKKDRNLACKRQWAKDNRIKKRLLKQLNTTSPSNPNRNKIEAELVEWVRKQRSQSVEKENIEQQIVKLSSESTPVFAPMDANSTTSTSYDYMSDLSGWSGVSQESSLPGLDAFERSVSEIPSTYSGTQDDEGVSPLLHYASTATSGTPYSPVSPPPSASHDDAIYSDEEAEEMMRFVERYSSVEAGGDDAVEEEASSDPKASVPPSRQHERPGAPSLDDPVSIDSGIEVTAFGSSDSAHLSMMVSYATADHHIVRQAIWKREQEEAEDEFKVEESLFTPATEFDGDDYGFDEGNAATGNPSSPVRTTSSVFDARFRSGYRPSSDSTGTPRLATFSKMAESPFHLKPVETTPDKRRLAWELGLGAESSPGSGFYRAQVKSAVAAVKFLEGPNYDIHLGQLMVGSAAAVRHLRTGLSIAVPVSRAVIKPGPSQRRSACMVTVATTVRNISAIKVLRTHATKVRVASTTASLARRPKTKRQSQAQGKEAEGERNAWKEAEVDEGPLPEKGQAVDCHLDRHSTTSERGHYVPDMWQQPTSSEQAAQDYNSNMNEDLEATYTKPIGPPPLWLHQLSENMRRQLRFVDQPSAARLRTDYSTASLESDIRNMLLQQPRAPGAIKRLQALWSVLWGSGRIREHTLAYLFGQLLARQGFYDDLRTVLQETTKNDLPFPATHFEEILKPLIQASAWQPLLEFIELAQSRSKTTARLLKMKTMALIGLGDYKCLDGMLSEFDKWGAKADREVYERLISAWMGIPNFQKVEQCISLMESAGYAVTADAWKALISGYVPNNDITVEERALAILRGLSNVGARALLHKVLTKCLMDRDSSGANFVLNLFEPSPIPERHQAFLAQGIPAILNDVTLVPTAMTFTILLRLLPNLSGFGDVPKLWRHMKTLGITPAPATIAALMQAHIEVGNLPAAGRIAYDTCRAKLTSDLRQAWMRFFDWSLEPPSIGFRQYAPSVQVFETLLGALLTSTGLRGVLLIISSMQATNVQPTSKSVQMITKFVRQHMDLNVAELSKLVTELATKTNQRAPTLQHLNQLLLATVQSNEQRHQKIGWRAFNSRFTNPRHAPDGVQLDPSITTTAGLAVSDLTGGAEFESIVDSLEARGQTPDAFTYNVRLRYEAVTRGDMAAAKRVLTEMTNRGIQPNAHHWLDLMRGFIRNGDMASAEAIITSMRFLKLDVDVRTYTNLIHGYAGLKQPHESMRVFQIMLEQGIRPDWGAVDALTGAYYGARQLENARRILLEYWSYVAPFPSELVDSPLSLLINNFRAMEDKAASQHVFSWDGGPVTDRRLHGRQKHSQSSDISEALTRTWQTVFRHGGSLSSLENDTDSTEEEGKGAASGWEADITGSA